MVYYLSSPHVPRCRRALAAGRRPPAALPYRTGAGLSAGASRLVCSRGFGERRPGSGMQDPFAKPDDSVTYGPQHGIGGMFSTPAGPAGIVAQSPHAHTQPQGMLNSLSNTAQPNFYARYQQQAPLHSPMGGGYAPAGYTPSTSNVALTTGSPFAPSVVGMSQNATTMVGGSPTWQPSPIFHGGVGQHFVSSPGPHGAHAAVPSGSTSIVDPQAARAFAGAHDAFLAAQQNQYHRIVDGTNGWPPANGWYAPVALRAHLVNGGRRHAEQDGACRRSCT